MTIDELRSLLKKASPTPWAFRSFDGTLDEDGYGHITECDILHPTGIQMTFDYEDYIFDWALLINAVNELPSLLDEVDWAAKVKPIAWRLCEVRRNFKYGKIDSDAYHRLLAEIADDADKAY